MLKDMYSVLDRISEIQKRFAPGRLNSIRTSVNKSGKFDEALNQQLTNDNQLKNTSHDKTIPVTKIKDMAREYAVKKGLPPALVDAVIKVESDFNQFAVSKKGAIGLMQLMPGVLKDMSVTNPFDAEDNIQAGTNILKNLMDKYEWDFKKALAAYNAGEKTVDKSNGIPPIKETGDYVKKVIDAYIQNIK